MCPTSTPPVGAAALFGECQMPTQSTPAQATASACTESAAASATIATAAPRRTLKARRHGHRRKQTVPVEFTRQQLRVLEIVAKQVRATVPELIAATSLELLGMDFDSGDEIPHLVACLAGYIDEEDVPLTVGDARRYCNHGTNSVGRRWCDIKSKKEAAA